MNSGPLLTVIVISKDDPEGLARTLRSIAVQSFREYEVVVVTKGRSDPFEDGGLQLPHLVRVQQSSAGISAAFNEGLGRAAGEWINFLNGGDCYADATVLERMRPGLRSAEMIVTARAADRSTGIRIPRDRSFQRRDLELVAHQASFFRKKLFQVHGAYSADYRIRMDFEWMLRIPPQTPVRWLDEVIVDFEGGGISTVRPVSNSLEELKALRQHRRGLGRVASLLAVYLPVRVCRHFARKLGSLASARRDA